MNFRSIGGTPPHPLYIYIYKKNFDIYIYMGQIILFLITLETLEIILYTWLN